MFENKSDSDHEHVNQAEDQMSLQEGMLTQTQEKLVKPVVEPESPIWVVVLLDMRQYINQLVQVNLQINFKG